MRFDTVIRNGTVVTATDTYVSDIGISGGRITAIAQALPIENAGKVIDATGLLVMPGGIDVHTHLDMPFGGTSSADDFESGTIAAAFGGTTTLIDFAIQTKGHSLRQAFDTWMKKADRKAAIDYAFHCIITDLGAAQLEEMGALIGEGVSSFKLFMAYPGVLMVDDATIFRAMSQAAKFGGLICMHAENGGVIDVIVQRALAEGKKSPKYHALTRPTTAEGEATSRAIALAEMAGAPVYIVHLSCNDALEKVREARDRGLPAYAETCPQYLYLSLENMDAPGFEGAKYVFTPPLREKWHQEKLWQGLANDTLPGGLDRSLPFLLQGAKGTRPRRFHENSQRRPRHRAPPEPHLHGRRARRAILAEPLRAARRNGSGEIVRPVSAQGHDRDRLGRRPRDLRSQPGASDQRGDPSHARRLFDVRRHPRKGCSEDSPIARPPRDRKRNLRRQTGQRRIHPPPAIRRNLALRF